MGVILLGAFLRMGNLGASSAWHDYDEGVHLTATLMNSKGMTLYRDFFFAHPPLIVYMLTPLARYGGVEAFASARALSAILSTATLVVLAAAASLTLGRRAALLGTLLLAIDGYTVYNSRMVMLEPPVDFFLSLGFLSYILSRRTTGPHTVPVFLILSGVAFGCAVGTKLSGAFGVLALITYCIVARRFRDLGPILPVAASTYLLISGPYLMVAPEEFIEQTVLFHLIRPLDGVPPQERASWILTSLLNLGVVWAGLPSLLISVLLVRHLRRHKFVRSEAYIWVIWALAYISMYSVTKTFYGHYIQHLMTPLSYVPGIVVESVGRVGGSPSRWGAALVNNILKILSALIGLAIVMQLGVVAYSAPPLRVNETPLLVAERLRRIGGEQAAIIAFEPIYTFLVDKFPGNRVADSYGHMIYVGTGLARQDLWTALSRYLNGTLYSGWPIYAEEAQRDMLMGILSSDVVLIDWRARWQLTSESMNLVYLNSAPAYVVSDIEIRIMHRQNSSLSTS
jgi:4-amino-4-deoxy-L-arabinose transferase-like glycosyltransferase